MKITTIPVTPFMQNCRILQCAQSAQAAIIDPGGDSDKIIRALTQRGIEPSVIWLTHGHLDHVGAADTLRKHYQIEIVGPQRDEQFWFDALAQQAQMFGFAPQEPFLPDTWLEHGQTISLGEQQFEIRHCPGHTPGHVIFVCHSHKLAVVGDVIFKGSIGRTDFPKGDGPTLIASIKREVLSLDDDYRLLSGHGEETSVGQERHKNPFISGKFG